MKWSVIFLGALSFVAGIVEIADAYQSAIPLWGKDGFRTGIVMLSFSLIGLLGLKKNFWKEPFFWEGV